MTGIGWYFIGTAIMGLLAYGYGRFLLPQEFVFPIPSVRVGRIVFVGLTTFILIRSCVLLLQRPALFDFNAIVEAYADVTIIVMATVFGYDQHKLRNPKSIKGSLAVAPDGGLQVIDPFTAPEDVTLGERKK